MASLKTLLSLTAAELVQRLLVDSTLSEVAAETGIDRSMLSRIACGMRTNEEHYRSLAAAAAKKKLF